jgi:hypothetical protein
MSKQRSVVNIFLNIITVVFFSSMRRVPVSDRYFTTQLEPMDATIGGVSTLTSEDQNSPPSPENK